MGNKNTHKRKNSPDEVDLSWTGANREAKMT
jgi:hypothetical protein